MTTGWNKATETAERISKASKVFIRLENNGDKAIGAFIGDPHTEEVIWNEKMGRNESFTKEHEAAGKKPSAKFYLNFYTIAEGSGDKVEKLDPPQMKVLQVSLKTFKKVLKAREKYSLEKMFFEIEREGKKGDTDTVYHVLPDKDIPENVKAELVKGVLAYEQLLQKGTKVPEGVIALHNLPKLASGAEDEDAHGEEASAKNKNGASEVIDGMKKRLKALPRSQSQKFLDKFGIAAIKDLKSDDFEKALAFIDELEGKPSAAAQENDPFA